MHVSEHEAAGAAGQLPGSAILTNESKVQNCLQIISASSDIGGIDSQDKAIAIGQGISGGHERQYKADGRVQ